MRTCAMIIESTGFSMLIIGSVIAGIAEKYAARTAEIESAGVLLLAGLALIGIGLNWTLNLLIVEDVI